jgi:hypothetical protein
MAPKSCGELKLLIIAEQTPDGAGYGGRVGEAGYYPFGSQQTPPMQFLVTKGKGSLFCLILLGHLAAKQLIVNITSWIL